MSVSQEADHIDTKSKSQKHCLKHTRNSRKSSATIYELQRIISIEIPLKVQHFKTYELKNDEREGSCNIHNFKTKPPFDKWSIYHMIEL